MTSVRRVSQEVNLSKFVVYHTMRNVLKYKPYKIHLKQRLYDEDQDLCVEMCERLILALEDEGNVDFYISGMVNKHNGYIWADKNLSITVDIASNSPKLTV
ncbi:unnamed protein product [Rotaria sordida]|uniref:Uncharacterized protein n=2 Tax=Rotaria sordida TaxID=392033 RepID=A0A819GGT0_9BILA|nr:unnamed protein product [Rotaria sordida]CAF3881666.1 unnamed protein product [Rotaria sordida]